MKKHHPSSPSESTFPYNDPDSEKLQEAADRALDYHPGTHPDPKPKASTQVFTVIDTLDTECLLANLSETLASASAMVNDLAFDLEGSRRHVALGVAQMIDLSELLANRALDIVDPR
ncbi:DUF6124 family protein [Pseudomonas thivervalensis]|uniref:DUF3077 domain-containing protein n=1 Tax=Pseudomonas thivervalensis TaxID=86265 RepID=A0A2Z4ZRH6_9PSED|nr:DUF6124 family protein [Pseudomonas thivervalensis]AXA55248.1 hypothetical protein CE140_13065 [Pseudomonas thivervalensis]AXA60935.1 hypothetical protein CEQ51_12935 [Pseudomonas thivervalensis]